MSIRLRNNDSLGSRLVVAFIASMLGVTVGAQSVERPRLVVGIVVEGLQEEYIDLLRRHFSDGGFNRLINNGVVIANADYGTAVDPAAATAMIFTGAAPARNGIPAAEVFDRNSLRPVGVLNDPSVLGNFTDITVSPRALAVTTIADEARIAGSGVTYAYAIASDPTQAVIMAGHAGNSAIWLNDRNANWATSSFYPETPTEIGLRNRMQPLRSRMDTMQWTPMLPADRYLLLPDHLTHYPFRYVYRPGTDTEKIAMLKNSPAVNAEVTSMAISHLDNLKLGSHEGGSDILSLAYTVEPFAYSKNTDNRYELQDAYYRLDANLAQLFNTIDTKVGLNNTLIFLAATPPPSTSRRDDERWNLPFGEFSTRKAMSLLNMYLMAMYGNGDWVTGYHRGDFYLNHKLIKDRNKNLTEVRREVASFLQRMSGVSSAFTIDDILGGEVGTNGDAEKRNTNIATAGDVRIAVTPGWKITDDFNNRPERPNQVVRAASATAPVFIMAPDVDPRRIDTPVDIRVVAPTVTRLMRIRSPNAASLPPLKLTR